MASAKPPTVTMQPLGMAGLDANTPISLLPAERYARGENIRNVLVMRRFLAIGLEVGVAIRVEQFQPCEVPIWPELLGSGGEQEQAIRHFCQLSDHFVSCAGRGGGPLEMMRLIHHQDIPASFPRLRRALWIFS